VVLANGRQKCRVCDFGGSTELVRLVGVSISLEKNFYRLPFTPPLFGRLIGPSIFTLIHTLSTRGRRIELNEKFRKLHLKFGSLHPHVQGEFAFV
jgi:hypothetical protein